MKHKGFFKNVFGLGLTLILGLFMASCGDDATPPTVELYVTVDGFTANIAVETTGDITSWHWDYGDGTESDSIGSHTHVYTESKDYTIKCTVTNADGLSTEASENITIATLEELLTAHTWVLSNTGSSNGVGFRITPELTISWPINDVLGTINSLRKEEEKTYDFTDEENDIYTFGTDGTFSLNTDNGNVLASYMFAAAYQQQFKVEGTCIDAGFAAIQYEVPKGSPWKVVKNATITINTIQDGTGPDDADMTPDDINDDGKLDENDIVPVKLENINYIVFPNSANPLEPNPAAGGFLGYKDFGVTDMKTLPFNQIAIIKSISSKELVITTFIHAAYDAESNLGIAEPCFLVTMTFKPGPTK